MVSAASLPFRCWVLVLTGAWVTGAVLAADAPKPGAKESAAEPFRPEPGRFPPLEKARVYSGELVFVDHANRRGSIRVKSSGDFRFTSPHPFALLPYALVRYHGAPADLRDIPLETVLHVRAYLPPDPKTSAVPVLPLKHGEKSGAGGPGTEPAENHVLLLEDEPSRCQREGLIWRFREIEIKNGEGTIVATRQPEQESNDSPVEETLGFDATTRIWRGRECLRIDHLIEEGLWPAEGKKSLGDQPVMIGLVWKPTRGGVFGRFHLSDIWLDSEARRESAARQTATHRAFIRSRWMPGWVDAVEYGQFGRATVTATLFGGMDESLYADFKEGAAAMMNGVENTLKHTEGGTAGPAQMAARGKILEVVKAPGVPPLGSSGIRIRFETDLITEGIRPTRIIKIRPAVWPDVHLPREEYLGSGASNIDERFPTPAIFPKY